MGEMHEDANTDTDASTTPSVFIRAYNSEDAFILVIPKSMIIRESPSPRKGGSEHSSWPPESPRQALLSSPSGRKRLQCISPSASKRRRLAGPNLAAEAKSDDDDEDEDEETVQLRLQAIEARLKLKKLQKAKEKIQHVPGEDATTSRENAEFDALRSVKPAKVEVPLSPKPQRANIQAPHSPRRVQLGIDKGLRAEEVSLKKARLGTNLAGLNSGPSSEASGNKHKSFSSRLAESRSHEKSRREKQERVDNRRSQGFGLSKMTTAADSRNGELTPALNRVNNCHEQSRDINKISPSKIQQRKLNERNSKTISPIAKGDSAKLSQAEENEPADLEPFSGFKLSKRKIDNSSLETAFKDKALISIPKLLKTVTAPDYDPPDVEDDYVVLGIIASKSLPRNHIPKRQIKTEVDPDDENVPPPRSKFMAIKLTDLKWEVDLFLFASAFDRFWKLTVGTVIAILNPGIMPPKPHMRDTGQFSLKISSSDDTLLEIGMSEDLGFCKSIKKDGKVCGQWIDGRKTDYCDFHVNLRVERAKAGRMEINGMANLGMFGKNARNIKGRGAGGDEARGRGGSAGGRGSGRGLTREGAYYDRFAGETGYSVPREFGGTINTSRMLDAEDYVQGGSSKAERSRRRIAEREKEHNLAKALGNQGNGMGSEYMRLKRGDGNATDGPQTDENDEEPVDASSLGLIGSNAQAVRLSPTKKKRKDGQSSAAEPMGWSGAFKRGLLSPSKKESRESVKNPSFTKHDKARQKETSPNKQARFLLKEKGIRVPGRESNGITFDADDDDDLDII